MHMMIFNAHLHTPPVIIIYAKLLLDVFQDEGINLIGMREDDDIINSSSSAYETLLCWVLVDPLQRHGFCRYT